LEILSLIYYSISTNSISKLRVFPAIGLFQSIVTVSSSTAKIGRFHIIVGKTEPTSKGIPASTKSCNSSFGIVTILASFLSPYASSGAKVMLFFSQTFIQTTAASNPGIISPDKTVNSSGLPLS
jgi:hypothetical protein